METVTLVCVDCGEEFKVDSRYNTLGFAEHDRKIRCYSCMENFECKKALFYLAGNDYNDYNDSNYIMPPSLMTSSSSWDWDTPSGFRLRFPYVEAYSGSVRPDELISEPVWSSDRGYGVPEPLPEVSPAETPPPSSPNPFSRFIRVPHVRRQR